MKAPRDLLERLLLLFAFVLPISISASELVFFVALLVWGRGLLQRRPTEGLRSPYLIPASAFIAVAGATLAWSVHPEITLDRLHRLAFPLLIGMMDTAWGATPGEGLPRRRLTAPLLWFVGGCFVLSVSELVRVPRAVAAGAELVSTGNMRDPQMFLAALCLLAGVTLPTSRRAWRPFYLPAFLFIGLGVLLHFKRGVWIGLLVAFAAVGARSGRRRILVLLGLAAVTACALPEVRHRIGHTLSLGEESVGGRAVLWKHAAPALLRAYPQGMGWSAVTHEDLAARTPFLQPNLNHLHNNLLQVAVETGWLGLAAWLAWMGTAFVVMWRGSRGPEEDPEAALGLGVWAAFLGLMVNGLFEYNFGDTEILMLLCFLMGLSSARYHRRTAR